MTVRRIMGTETEFGISVLGTPSANPMLTSSQLVNAYASLSARSRRARWDFEEESPLRDARGFDLSRNAADPSQLTDEDIGLANLILTNGARLYVDHAHPEYSTPEVTNPLDVVRWDKAGELVVNAAARAVDIPGQNPLVLYKNNTDNKGASYGAHENYLMKRATPFPDIIRHLTPFFVTRQVVCGAGRVGLGQDGRGPRVPDQSARRLLRGRGRSRDHAEAADHQHPRRAACRPRTLSPAARDHRRRQHGRDLVLSQGRAPQRWCSPMIEDGAISAELMHRRPGQRAPRGLARPDAAAPADAEGRADDDGHRPAGAVPRAGARATSTTTTATMSTCRPRTSWSGGSRSSTGLRRDPMECRKELDWVAKLALLESYRDRDGLEWDDPKLHLIDLQYADLRPDKGLYQRLVARGSIERLLDDDEVTGAVTDAAGGHPRLLPRPVPGPVPRPDRRRVVGLGDLRPARSRLAAADPHHGAVPRHQAACRCAARPLRHRRGAVRRAHRLIRPCSSPRWSNCTLAG